jgi:drug/metabolite transporter (DMT)-like permease
MSRRASVLFVAMCVIWGIPYLLIKVAVDEMSVLSLVLARTGLGALLLLPIAAAKGQLRPLLGAWKPLLAYTVIEISIPWLLLTEAERHITSSLAGLLVAAVPLVGALLAWGSGEERLGVRRITGLLVGLAGVAALVGLDLGATSPWALAAMAVVVVGYALGPFILARSLSHLPSLGVVAASLGLSALFYLPFGVTQLPSEMPSAKVLLSVAGLAVICTAVAFLLFFKLIAEIGPARATVITYVNPAVAVALGVLVLNESFTLATAVGFGLILTGSVLATRGERSSAVDPDGPGTGAHRIPRSRNRRASAEPSRALTHTGASEAAVGSRTSAES